MLHQQKKSYYSVLFLIAKKEYVLITVFIVAINIFLVRPIEQFLQFHLSVCCFFGAYVDGINGDLLFDGLLFDDDSIGNNCRLG